MKAVNVVLIAKGKYFESDVEFGVMFRCLPSELPCIFFLSHVFI